MENAGQLATGYNGRGSLAIVNGGRVSTNGIAVVGWQVGSRGDVVVGQDSSWSNTYFLDVGYQGQGSLLIDRGVVSSQGLTSQFFRIRREVLL